MLLLVGVVITLRHRQAQKNAAAAAAAAEKNGQQGQYDEPVIASSPIKPIPAPRPRPAVPQNHDTSFREEEYVTSGYLEVSTVQSPLALPDDPAFEVPEVADDSDELQPWFADSLRRSVCERAVASAQHGDFLIRKSSTPGSFVLVVNNNGTRNCCGMCTPCRH